MKDCREIELAISALHDGAITAQDEIAAVREHCASCASCSSFADALRALDRLPAPVAPAALADRVAAAMSAEAEKMAQAAREAASTAAAAGPPDGAPVAAVPLQERLAVDAKAPAWLTRTRLWAITGGVAASAAVIITAVVLSQGLEMRSGLDSAARGPVASPPAAESNTSGSTSATVAGAPATTAQETAPDYIVFGGAVYVGEGNIDATGSALTTLGVVPTSLDLGGSALNLTVFRSGTDALALVLGLPTGSYRRFGPVTRKYGARTYQLQSGTAIARFGEWPRLVGSIPEPTRADGYPVMQKYGLDSAGVPVYVRIGANPDGGFAVAPGTSPNDPAAGNPFWTWWAPVPSP